MHIDFKITTWERVEIPKGMEREIFSKIEDGTISSANGLFSFTPTDGSGYLDLTCEKLEDTDEQMTPEENGGCSTIEVWEQVTVKDNKPMQCTWQNGE
jgi:hypothetical protein